MCCEWKCILEGGGGSGDVASVAESLQDDGEDLGGQRQGRGLVVVEHVEPGAGLDQ